MAGLFLRAGDPLGRRRSGLVVPDVVRRDLLGLGERVVARRADPDDDTVADRFQAHDGSNGAGNRGERHVTCKYRARSFGEYEVLIWNRVTTMKVRSGEVHTARIAGWTAGALSVPTNSHSGRPAKRGFGPRSATCLAGVASI